MKTKTDLIHRALKNLGVLPSGAQPAAEEYNTVDELVGPMVEDLIARDVYSLGAEPDDNSAYIPDEAFMHLGLVLAWCAAPEFGAGNDAALAARAVKAEQDLRVISAVRYSYDIAEIEAF